MVNYREPFPPRPGDCNCSVCVNGYIRCSDWELGRYVWRECSNPVHNEVEEETPEEAGMELKQ